MPKRRKPTYKIDFDRVWKQDEFNTCPVCFKQFKSKACRRVHVEEVHKVCIELIRKTRRPAEEFKLAQLSLEKLIVLENRRHTRGILAREKWAAKKVLQQIGHNRFQLFMMHEQPVELRKDQSCALQFIRKEREGVLNEVEEKPV